MGLRQRIFSEQNVLKKYGFENHDAPEEHEGHI
jgi:hypothetical protein